MKHPKPASKLSFLLWLLLLLAFAAAAQPETEPTVGPAGAAVLFPDFRVAPAASGTQLRWDVSSSTGALHFVVERSFDGQHFTAIGTVAATTGGPRYTFTDGAVRGAARSAWYRIRAEWGHDVTHSPVRALRAAFSTLMTISPNPAQGRILVSGKLPEAGPVVLQVTGANGAIVHTERTLQGAGAFRRYIPLDGLPAGMYWIRMTTAAGEECRSFVKQ